MDSIAENIPRSIINYFPISNSDELFSFVTNFILGIADEPKKWEKDELNERSKVCCNEDANIALLSIVLGIIEHSLTNESEEVRAKLASINTNSTKENANAKYKRVYDFPIVELDVVLSFYSQFQNVIHSYVDLSEYAVNNNTHIAQSDNRLRGAEGKLSKDSQLICDSFAHALEDPDTVNNNLSQNHKFYVKKMDSGLNCYCTKELLKCVSDAIWVRLQKSYQKDRSHQQSVFSFLTTWRLDSFGVAVCVVAAAQLLRLKDVHLALSEDHAWVTFGESQMESAEVTWHGKALEDKRGESITDSVSRKRWLYLGGVNAIKCDRASEVAACIASMSMSIGSGSERTDNSIVAFIQQKLLWHMYHMGLLDNYPTCISLLADLEDIQPYESCDTSPPQLYQRAIRSSVVYYSDSFVYPYVHLGKHCLRKNKLRESLANWARAATVIGKYNYDKEEEEIYREFYDIATIHIPSVVRRQLATDNTHNSNDVNSGCQLVCEDPISLCYIVQFMDGVCRWEEGSSTPVLHISWAEKFLPVFSLFSFEIRKQIIYISENVHTSEAKFSSSSSFIHHNSTGGCGMGGGGINDDHRNNNTVGGLSSVSLCSPLSDTTEGGGGATSLHHSMEQQQPKPKSEDLHAILEHMSKNMFAPLCYLGAPDSLTQPSPLNICEKENKIQLHVFSKKMKLICELIQNEKFNPHTATLQLTAQTCLNSERKRVKSNPYVDFTYLTSKRKK